MLRFGFFASTLPLLLIVVATQGNPASASRPCIALGDRVAKLAVSPWLATHQVSFTTDAARATVRVKILDAPDAADFTVIDDIATADASACDGAGPARLIAIAPSPSATAPVIYLTQDGEADYRIFVRSRAISLREAAALIVGAGGARDPLLAASFDGRS